MKKLFRQKTGQKVNQQIPQLVSQIQKLYDERKDLGSFPSEKLTQRLQEIRFQKARLNALERLPNTPLDLQITISKVFSDLEEIEEETQCAIARKRGK